MTKQDIYQSIIVMRQIIRVAEQIVQARIITLFMVSVRMKLWDELSYF